MLVGNNGLQWMNILHDKASILYSDNFRVTVFQLALTADYAKEKVTRL